MPWLQTGSTIQGEATSDHFGYQAVFSDDGSILAISGFGNDKNGFSAGHVEVYEYTNSEWSQLGNDLLGQSDGYAQGDLFGYALSLSSDGQKIAIGSFMGEGGGELNNSGHVSVYEYVNNQWVQVGSDIDGEAESDFSGSSVSLSSDGNTVAIGAINNDGNGTDSGHVRIFKCINNEWIQVGDDIDGEAAGDYSGISVSLSNDGNTVAIGAINNDGNGTDSGHVRVYEYTNNQWVQVGSDIDGEAAGDYFGTSVKLSSDGKTIAVGATQNDGNGSDSGYVRVYEYTNNQWVQVGSDIDGEAVGDYFGMNIDLSDDGSYLVASGDGHTKIFSKSNNTWIEITDKIISSTDGVARWANVSISNNGNYVALGEYWDDQVRTFEFKEKSIVDEGDASFSIVGTKDPGNYLSIKRDSQDPDGTGKISYQWQISSDNSYFENASTKSSYKLRMDDANKYLRAIISYTDDDGFSESIQTSSVQISSNISLSNSHFTNLGFSEKFGTNNSDNISSSGGQILWGLGGNDNLTNSYSSYDQYLIGGSGNDSYTIKSGTVTLVYEAPNAGYDTLTLQASYAYGYVATLDNKHLIAIENSYGNSGIIVLNAIDAQGGIDEIYFGGAGYSANYFLSVLSSFPGYLGNISWDQLKPYIGDLFVNTAKNTIDQLKISATSLENSFNDINSSSDEVLYSNQIVGNTYHLTAIRDYDGNFHANNGSVSDEIKSSYKYQGNLDVNKDGISEAIYTNKKSGRWVTAYVNDSTGEIDYSDHGKDGTTRIVGIYIDPLVTSGEVVQFSDHDSQHRFQNDLKIDNLLVKTAGDYDNDGFQEVYWKTADGTAYLRSLMHTDGNIQYANYQSEYQMNEYLVSNGYASIISEILN